MGQSWALIGKVHEIYSEYILIFFIRYMLSIYNRAERRDGMSELRNILGRKKYTTERTKSSVIHPNICYKCINSAILVPLLTLVSQIQCIFIFSSYVKVSNYKIVWNIFPTGSVLAGEQVWHGVVFFTEHVQQRSVSQEIWSPDLQIQNWYCTRDTKNFRKILKLSLWVLKIIYSRDEGDVCVSAVEFLVWFSGPGYKAQEPRDQASHTGFPCRSPACLALLLMLFCQSWGIHISIVPGVHIRGEVSVVREQLPPDPSTRAEMLHGSWCLWASKHWLQKGDQRMSLGCCSVEGERQTK